MRPYSEEIMANGNGPSRGPLQNQHFSARLKQTMAVIFYLWTLMAAPSCILLCALFPFLWPIAGLYFLWFIYDFKSPCRGARFSQTIHDWPLWKHMANYFPVEVHKTAEIPPDQNYIFCAHPHGIFGSSSMLLFSTGAHKTRQLFPHIKIRGATLAMNFWFPIRREFFMSMGIISCSADSIGYLLSRPEKGFAVGLVPGGAEEALESIPSQNRLILAHRKGFIRLAIKYGAHLVPVYHFGETNLYQQISTPKGSIARKFQEFIKHWTSVSFPLIFGQNFLASLLPDQWLAKMPRFLTFGMLPFRRKVITVVGAPIPVERDECPSQEKIDAVHGEYCDKLRELFDEHKTRFMEGNAVLEFI